MGACGEPPAGAPASGKVEARLAVPSDHDHLLKSPPEVSAGGASGGDVPGSGKPATDPR
jgi:hypothetical protein